MRNWDTSEIFCPNCGKKLIGYEDEKGQLIIECNNCFISIRRKRLTRRKAVIETERRKTIK